MTNFSTGLGRRSEQILLMLRSEIERGVWPINAKLPTERQLCERFNASTPTIRRAVARLVHEGKLRVRQGSGMYVCSDADAPTISLMYHFDGPDLTDAQSHALSHGHLLCVYSQTREGWNPKAEREFFQLILKQTHRALLAFCSPLEPHNDDLLHELATNGTRVIHVEHYREQLPDQEYVLPDYERAGHMAAMSLMLAGYRKLAYVSSTPDAPYSRLLQRGFDQALREHGDGPDAGDAVFHLRWALSDDAAHDEAFDTFRARLGASVGFVCSSAHIALDVANFLRQRGGWTGDSPPAIGPTLIGPPVDADDIDVLAFDRTAILRAAMDAAFAPGSPARVQELVPPRWGRGGAV